jgi:hypothetical protein
MKKWWIILLAPPAIVLLTALCGEVVMHLWNWLLPTLFGWRQITFWQGLGLLILCRILFGSWSGGSDRSHSRHFRGERWKRMTPEQREKCRQAVRARFSGFGSPADETGKPT